jgi:divalent metal cation (Fe/Co/Zn/Cd) transporter
MIAAMSAAESVIEHLRRRGLRLEYATFGWNVVGSVLVLTAAVSARSVALAGFGLDSLIEIVASLVLVWQLRELQALRVIGVAFLLLAIYIAAQSVYVVASEARPHRLPARHRLARPDGCAMFALAAGKRATGRALRNRVLETEARVTAIDGLLTSAVLAGLILNAAAGWWRADPAAAFVIVYYGLREGWQRSQSAERQVPSPQARWSIAR